jgi:GTP-binding protein HflX
MTAEQRPGPILAAVVLPWAHRGRPGAGEIDSSRAAEARLAEAVGLAAAINLVVVHTAILTVRKVIPATLLGSGQVGNLRDAMADEDITVVIVDAQLTPVQQRNLETAWSTKVIDRTGLILDIFGERAATSEGALQVELAHLEYQRSRLVRSWTHLERQRGGFGFLGGPGETQIEADRRLIGDRIVKLKRELDQVRRTRGLHRTARRRTPFPTVALVGYTNAGKSTLFNALTGAEVEAKDLLFATLDPTMRGLRLPSGRRAILSDTVGFVSELPTELIAAFRATLEEVAEADVILHVRDAAHPDSAAQKADVETVLDGMTHDSSLGPATLSSDWRTRTIEVLNKTDLLADPNQLSLRSGAVAVSAITGAGLPALRETIDARLAGALQVAEYRIDPSDGARLAWLYQHGEVFARDDSDAAISVSVRLLPADRARFEQLP